MSTDDRLDPFKNLQNFKPKTETEAERISADISEVSKDIQRISEKNGFHSREARVKPQSRAAWSASPEPKRQFNIKVNESDYGRFYEQARIQNVRSLGDLFKMLLDSFERENETR